MASIRALHVPSSANREPAGTVDATGGIPGKGGFQTRSFPRRGTPRFANMQPTDLTWRGGSKEESRWIIRT